MKALLFELDGVLYQGDRPIEGGADTPAWVRERGIRIAVRAERAAHAVNPATRAA